MFEYIAPITGTWELAKALKVSVDAIDDAQIKLQMAELIVSLSDAKIAAADATERIADLERQLKSKSEMKFNGNVYQKIDEDGKEWAMCVPCFDSKSIETRLLPNGMENEDGWRCGLCNLYYETSKGR
jgi:hypothetical protein